MVTVSEADNDLLESLPLCQDGFCIPAELTKRLVNEEVVFFCGAGISYPLGLGGFAGLVKNIKESLVVSDANVDHLMDGRKYDLALSIMENIAINNNFITEGIERWLGEASYEDVSTHINLLKMSMSNHRCRIVTTNYDQGFEKAVEQLQLQTKPTVYSYPALPIPKLKSFEGIVHLHGNFSENTTPSRENFIVTSKDFGRSYLVDGVASRFVNKLLQEFTVVFVGYSLEDPIIQYILEANIADNGKTHYVISANSNDLTDGINKHSIFKFLGLKVLSYEAGDEYHTPLHDSIEKLAFSIGNADKHKKIVDYLCGNNDNLHINKILQNISHNKISIELQVLMELICSDDKNEKVRSLFINPTTNDLMSDNKPLLCCWLVVLDKLFKTGRWDDIFYCLYVREESNKKNDYFLSHLINNYISDPFFLKFIAYKHLSCERSLETGGIHVDWVGQIEQTVLHSAKNQGWIDSDLFAAWFFLLGEVRHNISVVHSQDMLSSLNQYLEKKDQVNQKILQNMFLDSFDYHLAIRENHGLTTPLLTINKENAETSRINEFSNNIGFYIYPKRDQVTTNHLMPKITPSMDFNTMINIINVLMGRVVRILEKWSTIELESRMIDEFQCSRKWGSNRGWTDIYEAILKIWSLICEKPDNKENAYKYLECWQSLYLNREYIVLDKIFMQCYGVAYQKGVLPIDQFAKIMTEQLAHNNFWKDSYKTDRCLLVKSARNQSEADFILLFDTLWELSIKENDRQRLYGLFLKGDGNHHDCFSNHNNYQVLVEKYKKIVVYGECQESLTVRSGLIEYFSGLQQADISKMTAEDIYKILTSNNQFFQNADMAKISALATVNQLYEVIKLFFSDSNFQESVCYLLNKLASRTIEDSEEEVFRNNFVINHIKVIFESDDPLICAKQWDLVNAFCLCAKKNIGDDDYNQLWTWLFNNFCNQHPSLNKHPDISNATNWALNSLDGKLTEGLIDRYIVGYQDNLKDKKGEGISDILKNKLNYVINHSRYGMTIVCNYMELWFWVDENWTVEHILPLFVWNDTDPLNAICAWSAWLYRRNYSILKLYFDRIKGGFYEAITEQRNHLGGIGKENFDRLMFDFIGWTLDDSEHASLYSEDEIKTYLCKFGSEPIKTVCFEFFRNIHFAKQSPDMEYERLSKLLQLFPAVTTTIIDEDSAIQLLRASDELSDDNRNSMIKIMKNIIPEKYVDKKCLRQQLSHFECLKYFIKC